MRKIKNLFLILLVLITLVGCTGGNNLPVTNTIKVTPKVTTVELEDTEVLDYDYLSLFTITENNQDIEVLESYVDKSLLKEEVGTYKVTCTYKNTSATVKVIVTTKEDLYDLTLLKEEIEVNKSLWNTYDYLSLFEAKVNGENVTITADMIENNVKPVVGTYTYVVTFNNIKKTLTVHIIDIHTVEVIPAYQLFEISLSEIESFDYTKLFNLYVDGQITKVTDDFIDISKLANIEVGKTYDIVFDTTINNINVNKKITIKVIEDNEVVINAKNVTVYPNGSYIDLTTLFSITKGDEIIPVTMDMISGSIDYSQVGTNIITLKYQEFTKEAVVEVKRGVIIDYATSDTITITKGTNQDTYDFIGDFVVVINGVKFDNISINYLDTSIVDFNKVGSYKAKLTIPYNDQALGLQGVKFTYVEKEITYVVTKNKYEIKVLNDVVELNKNVTKYNPFDNLKVTINGRNQTLTKNEGYVDIITCYAQELSNPIDLTLTGTQNVKIALYVNGVDETPVIVEFKVVVLLDIVITSQNAMVIAGGTLYTKDLFTITENNEKVEVTNEYITGIVDLFTPGIYEVTITYKNIEKTSKVVVLSSQMMGTYHTKQTTIPEEVDSDDDEVTYGAVTRLKDLIISQDGSITVNGMNATIKEVIDENTLIISILNNDQKLIYNNGIIVINPLNKNKMQFNEYSRPLVYFHEDIYKVNKCYIINYGNSYVLSETYMSYSIDLLKVTNKKTEEVLWYALKVQLIEKNSADTVYDVTYGEASIPSDYDFTVKTDTEEVEGVLTFNGEQYKFVMQNASTGKVSKETVNRKYANMTFTGKVDGVDAKLTTTQYEGFNLLVNNKLVLSVNTYNISSMKNGGIDYENDTLFFYNTTDDIYSYKFKLNVQNKTFELIEKDNLFGKYVYDKMYIFLDGYGSGVVNFNTDSYYTTEFKYEAKNSDIKITYLNTKSNFEYEDESTFYIDTFNNVLTSKSFMNNEANNLAFENQYITTGAIIRINSYVVGADSDTVAKRKMLDNITIITKDGELSDSEKTSCINTSRIKFSKAGFYQFTITINVNGEDVVAYYAIQIIESIYKNNPVVGEYVSGVVTKNNSLSIDEYGRATLVYSDLVFNGSVTINSDNSFIIKASSTTKGNVTITGQLLANGIVYVECGGAVAFSNYYTTGLVSSTGNGKLTLHKISCGGVDSYLLFDGTSTSGTFVDCTLVSDNIYKLEAFNVLYYVKILNFENEKTGLSAADEYRGVYTSNGETLTIDGFGGVSTGNSSGTYTLNGNIITAILGLNAAAYRLDKENMTFEKLNIVLDNSLVSGRTYAASYSFVCSGYYYTAYTKFVFSKNGKVTIISTSDEHDSGSEGCTEDSYNPVFASKTGLVGSYSVSGNQVIIKVNNYTFTFTITDIINVDNLVTNTTNLDTSEHGYFGSGTVFSIE